ncbi:uncharacterized protein DDB_G0287625-like [Telopea speciosissima]|uniref:uncharacterized protein DDB_G0287625-like n=1 Tax=Telopea speciosissima TaxID=54955 RepID=UPI001CC55D29|nr:uncharacterized protein DDB_G0287625-like [Telopea speciosissima]
MEREMTKHHPHRGEGLCRASTESTSTEFVLQWGNRKRLRCMKVQIKDDSTDKTTVRVDRRVVRADKDPSTSTPTATATANNNNNNNSNHNNLNLRRLPPSSSSPHRILRNSETSSAMRGQSNGMRSSSSPETGGEDKAQDKKGSNTKNNHHNHNNGNGNGNGNGVCVGGSSPSSETAQDSKKGGSPSESEAIPVWPPKFVIALTNKEKEEDFMAIKGSKLPQRPKKRAKFIQRTLNLVCPGSWLCDLTLERYEVREKKITKKRPRGLKAMGNVDSDSE